jgi:hypothetical protein
MREGEEEEEEEEEEIVLELGPAGEGRGDMDGERDCDGICRVVRRRLVDRSGVRRQPLLLGEDAMDSTGGTRSPPLSRLLLAAAVVSMFRRGLCIRWGDLTVANPGSCSPLGEVTLSLLERSL